MSLAAQVKLKLKEYAFEEGFAIMGFAEAGPLPESIHESFAQWLERGHHGSMSWLERHLDWRRDPVNVFAEVESIMVVGLYYGHCGVSYPGASFYKMARYALHQDYHKVIKKKLKRVLRRAQAVFPELAGRAVSDSAPLDETYWAQKAGIGFVGKNNLLIHPRFGSFLLLGELLLNLKLPADEPMAEGCADCLRCVRACPTRALNPYELDARRCLSYLTIEAKGGVAPFNDYVYKDSGIGWLFGCDRCMDVCPYNQRAQRDHRLADLRALPFRPSLYEALKNSESWSREEYHELSQGTPVRRISWERFRANIEAWHR